MPELVSKNAWPWWQAIKDWWTGKTGRYLIVYPPLDTKPNNFKPWDYPREPTEYKTFWEAHREAEFINRMHGKVIAIVCEYQGTGPLPANPPKVSDLPPKPDAPPQYHRTRKKKNYRSIDD
jgi:hypothetical protein